MVIDWSTERCTTFGKEGHESSDCWLNYSLAHQDRNIENIAFHLSTKGKKWVTNIKDPYCNPRFLLDGSSRVPSPRPQEANSKFMKLLLSSVIDKNIIDNNSPSDYLKVFITLL